MMCSATYISIPDLDEHYSSVHADFMPVQCTECPIFCPNRAQLKLHLEWHRNEDRDTKSNDFASICCYCGKFFANGPEFDHHSTTCTENGTPDAQGNDASTTGSEINSMYKFTYTYSTSHEVSMDIHNAPHTTRQTPQDHTSSDLLCKIVTDTIYGDISQDNNDNPHNTAVCPSHPMDTTHPGLEDSQNHSVLEPHPAASYREKFHKEVRLNEGNHPGRSWEENLDGLT